MYLNLSFDHQVIDGAPAARFLQAVKRNLELPAALLL
jgi:pyruvate dehydrogenase E2 component (dihydrolipoamide acetyltransferase)